MHNSWGEDNCKIKSIRIKHYNNSISLFTNYHFSWHRSLRRTLIQQQSIQQTFVFIRAFVAINKIHKRHHNN